MARPQSLAVLAVLALSAAVFADDPTKPSPPKPLAIPTGLQGASYVHTVIFHLKKDAPPDTADKVIADCHTLLEPIPTVRLLRASKPAAEDQSTPKVAVRDYDVALLVLFDDPAGLKTYIDHDLHKKFVATYEKYFDKVEVFDFLDTAKK
ncbi:MAG TPA: Dabb family protein [Gemmataceae bacterium]|nr:Dabb family protein [Gemmataceae bacterium]